MIMSDEHKAAPAPEEDVVSGVQSAGGDPTAWMVAVVAVVSVVALLAIIIFLRGMFQRAQDAEYYAKVVSQPQTELLDLWDKQQTTLNSTRWIDPQAGVISIPIDQAMALTIDELNRDEARGYASAPVAAAASGPAIETQSKNPANPAGQKH
jgi:hypothetical protein